MAALQQKETAYVPGTDQMSIFSFFLDLVDDMVNLFDVWNVYICLTCLIE
jgi:hypothetical protein